jgi:hypothetical protein
VTEQKVPLGRGFPPASHEDNSKESKPAALLGCRIPIVCITKALWPAVSDAGGSVPRRQVALRSGITINWSGRRTYARANTRPPCPRHRQACNRTCKKCSNY